MRSNSAILTALLLLFSLLTACADDPAGSSGDGGGSDAPPDDLAGDMGTDGGVPDGGGDSTPDSPQDGTPQPDSADDTGGDANWATCIPHPLGEERCGDGFDDDCDGLIDEGCACGVSSNTQPCYPGNPAEIDFTNTGCQAGTQSCVLEFWDDCTGAVGPALEICDDDVDNDCDGSIDEGCAAEPPEAICPADITGPVLRDYTLNGDYSDPNDTPLAVGFWSQLSAPPGHSRDITSSGLDLTFFADVTGDYVFELTVQNTAGLSDTCQTRVTTETDDFLRIEMFWNDPADCVIEVDGEGNVISAPDDTSDVDLLLRRDPTGDYRYYGTSSTCYWDNCATCTEPYNGDAIREVRCRDFLAGEPPAGYPENDPWPPSVLDWGVQNDRADDPRLDLDDVEGCGPENLNILRPQAGTYRVAIHYFAEDTFAPAVTTSVRILCGGVDQLIEDIVLRTHPGNFLENDIWEVGDLVITGSGASLSCQFQRLGNDSSCHICPLADSAGGCGAASCG